MTYQAYRYLWTFLLVSTGALGWPAQTRAESLRDSLRAAYESNPELDAERARLRAIDEQVPQARSGYRPTIVGEATVQRTNTESDPQALGDGSLTSTQFQLNLSQPIFRGFRTTNAVNRAEALVRSGRENLRRIESTILLNAATAYMDIIRDKAILRLRERNVSVLSQELEAAKARSAVREVTLTDVSQARSRRARAVSEADVAKANLRISRANFRQVVGHAPAALGAPPLRVANLPRSLNDALSIADRESPEIVSALYQEQAQRFAVDEVWGELLPSVNLEASYNHETNPSRFLDKTDTASITGRLTVPLYRGGSVHSRVRQAKHTHVGTLQDIEKVRTETEARVTAAWSRLVAARAQLSSARIEVEAARTALEGVREEEKVGQRTLLDVLNAEQEYLDAQVSRVITRRDLIVASYALLATIGRLTAEWIDEIKIVYDPEEHYEETRNSWIGVTITHPYVEPESDYEIADHPALIEAPSNGFDSLPSVFGLFKQTYK